MAAMVYGDKLWRCDCGSEALGVSFYSSPHEHNEWFIEVYKIPARYSWRWRRKTIWDLLLGREVVIDAVSLDRQKVTELMAFLGEGIAEATPGDATYTGNSPTVSTLTTGGPRSTQG